MQFVQSAYLVADIYAAARFWAEQLGAGPFFVLEHIELHQVYFAGRLSGLDHSSAYGWLGDEMIELVQQNCATASVFSNRDWGLHHRACYASDFDAELARLAGLGWPTAMTAQTDGGLRFAFADANAELGHFIEVYEESPQLREFYAQVRLAHQSWDGVDPFVSR